MSAEHYMNLDELNERAELDIEQEALTAAARDVLAERRRQIEAEGWTPEHDDEHDGHEMAHAAACYAYPELTALIGVKTWPWDPEWLKVRDHRSNYVRAAALLLAEIERIDRADARKWRPCAHCITTDYCTNQLRGCDITESLESGIEPISGSAIDRAAMATTPAASAAKEPKL